MKFSRFCASIAALALAISSAHAVVLSTGARDGTVSVGVDGFGSFGSSIGGDRTSDAIYNPVGQIAAAGTTFESGIAVDFGGSQPFLTTGSIGGVPAPVNDLVITGQTATSLSSTFSLGSLTFTLVQTVADSVGAGGVTLGAVLNQIYTITNTAGVTNSFDVVRYIDGDLDFDNSINDGGGRIIQSGSEILFETDSASGENEATTFLGITATGGVQPASNRFQISSFSALRDNIAANVPLADFIQNDTDGDGFVDTPFDVTMALRNEFSLAPGQSATFTTQTLFGNAVPPRPGSIEALPLLPNDIDPNGAFVFNVDGVLEGETIFFDPDIATGYTYTVTGADFNSVTAPSLGAVNDPDGYILSFSLGGTDFVEVIMPGEEFDFSGLGSGLTSFSLTGIDPALALDPANILAFVTGISFVNISAQGFTLLQTPILTNIDPDPNAVPIPGAVWLFVSGLFGLGWSKRKRQTA